MGLGVLDAGDGHVPGTSLILDADNDLPDLYGVGEGLKFDRTGRHHVILVPQPSDDPNDPLNWPLWKRDVILAVLCLMSLVASTLSPLLAATTVDVSLHFTQTFTNGALLTGYHLCGVAVGGVVSVATARIWGKRHLYLLGTILIIISCAWGGNVGHNFTSLTWARIIQGVGLAPFEALVNASVGDLYFVHERGVRMAISNMALFGGAFATPIIVGKISHVMGWQWSFNYVAISAGVMLPLIFFFAPETTFKRPERFNIDLIGAGNARRIIGPPPSQGIPTANSEIHILHVAKSAPEGIPTRKSYWQSLHPFNGRKTNVSLFKLILRPFPLFLHPAVLWGCLIQGTLIGWTVMIGVVLAAIFFGPPLWLDEEHIGYMYIGALIGAVSGFVAAGLLADWSTRWMIRRNHGVYEPEFRILLVIPQMIAGCAGLYGFGITSNDVHTYGKYWPDFFFGLEVMGMVIGAVASALYLVDAHREIAVEAFTCLLIFKNMFSFGMTRIAYKWLLEAGIRHVFIIIASIQLGICLLSIPMYVLGKKNRSMMSKYDLLRMLGLS